MRKLILDINNDDDFQIEGSNLNKGLIFFGRSDKEALEKLQKFIEDKIRKIIILGASQFDGKTIKSYRGSRISNIEDCFSKIYKAAGELKTSYNLVAGNWNFSYVIK